MSNRLLTLAKSLPIRGRAKGVLIVLADAAHDDGACWQSIPTLASWAGMGASTAWRHLSTLEGMGLVSRRRRRNEASVLHVEESAMLALAEGKPVAEVIEMPSTPEPVDDSQVENSQVENSQVENSRNETENSQFGKLHIRKNPNRTHTSSSSKPRQRRTQPDQTDEFTRFWAIYPRRVGKQAAAKALEKALQSTDIDRIITGAQAYAADVRRRGTEREFIAHPATWINAGRWDDELTDNPAPVIDDPIEWLRAEWKAKRVKEIHKYYRTGYDPPSGGDGDYLEDVLKPYNRQWITAHHDAILARLISEAS